MRRQRGQALVEAALAFPLLVVLALALVQFTLYAHAVDVAEGACQDGARVAAQADRSVSDGVATTRSLLQAGLGPSAGQIAVTGQTDGQIVVVRAQGQAPLLLPWLGGSALPVKAMAQADKEGFRANGG